MCINNFTAIDNSSCFLNHGILVIFVFGRDIIQKNEAQSQAPISQIRKHFSRKFIEQRMLETPAHASDKHYNVLFHKQIETNFTY